MNKIIVISLLLPSFIFGQKEWQLVGGKEYTIEANIYNLKSKTTDTLSLDGETIFSHIWLGGEKKGTHPVAEYKLKTTTYPSNFIHSDSSLSLIEGFLNSTILNLAENPNYEYVNSSLEFFDGYPGKDFKFKDLRSNHLFNSKCYLVQNQLIEFITISKPTNWFSNSKSHFFESLNLIDRNENEKDYGIPIIKSDSYSVSFYRTPKVQNFFVDAEEGLINTKIKIDERESKEGNLVFMSSESKYNYTYQLKEKELDSFYSKSMLGSINSMNGKFISKNEISFEGHKGIEFYADLFEGRATCYFRKFWINNTMYNFAIMYTDEKPNAEGLKFMNSFNLVH